MFRQTPAVLHGHYTMGIFRAGFTMGHHDDGRPGIVDVPYKITHGNLPGLELVMPDLPIIKHGQGSGDALAGCDDIGSRGRSLNWFFQESGKVQYQACAQ